MKVNLNTEIRNKKNNNEINFKGYKPVKDEFGGLEYEFSYPFDENKYDCYLEVYSLGQDRTSEYPYIKDIVTSKHFRRQQLKNPDYNGEKGIKLNSGKNNINLADIFGFNDGASFAYHYKLVEKNNPNNTFFKVDAGNVIDNTGKSGMGYDIYNIVYGNASKVNKGGAMKLVIPDNYNVMWVYDEKDPTKIIKNKNFTDAKNSVKTAVNKIGGSLAGLEKDIEAGKFDNFSRIISTPIFTDDSLTAHSYWNKNCMQMASSLGNINNYASLQRKMFAKGINFVSDGAFVNEGLEGVHFKHILKWGERSPYFYWFRIYALQDSPFTLGVFGKNMTDQKGNSNVAQRLVNGQYEYFEENGKIKRKANKKYNPHKPTYIQVYDKRLIKDPSKLDPSKLIESYDKLNTDNIFDINNHNDTIIPYSFPINEETYEKNMANLIEYNKHAKKPIKLDSFEATRMLTKFENFEFEEKFESGIETWDANADIIKLNYAYSHTDTNYLKQTLTTEERKEMMKLLKAKNNEVQDYAVTSGQYWTKKTRQILMTNIAQNLKKSEIKAIMENDPQVTNLSDAYYKLIMQKSNNSIFPISLKSKLNKEIVENVINNEYDLPTQRSFKNMNFKDIMQYGLMDLPLDTIEFGDDIVATLASPFITKRAEKESDIGLSRYDFIKQGGFVPKEYAPSFYKMNHIYKHEMSRLAEEILDNIDIKSKELPEGVGIKNGENSTQLGRYLIPQMTAEIAKFAVIKSLYPKAEMKVDENTGEISYDYKKLKSTSLQEIGIIADSPRNEADAILAKLERNIPRFSAEDKVKLTNALIKSIRGTNIESYKLAEMIIDRTQAGLDWRIDATKDIADINALKAQKMNFEQTWDSIIDFWKKFNKGILKENPNAYIAAEITDVYPIQNETDSPSSEKYPTHKESERQILNKAMFTTMANYSYFFKDIAGIFSKTFEGGESYIIGDSSRIFNLLVGSVDKDPKEFLRSASLPAIMYSYNVLGNHDVPRALHCLSLDMELFYTDLTSPQNAKYRELAYRILNDKFDGKAIPQSKIDNMNWHDVNSKAVAMGDSLNRGFGQALKEHYKDNPSRQKEVWEKISPAIADLANGYFKGKHFEAEAFGVKPFDKTIEAVIEQAEYAHGLRLDPQERKDVINKTFQTILEPSYTKLLGIMKFLVALPGNPTLFSGDELGSTGYETKTKNIFLQNRSYLHNEWVSPKSSDHKDFIVEKKQALDLLFEFRKRPEMHALNDGAPFTLNPMRDSQNGAKICGLFRQSTDGAMAISLFNAGGMVNNFEKGYSPQYVKIDAVNLSEGTSNAQVGLAAGIKPGLIFANGYNKDEKYVVREFNGKYFLKKYNGPNSADGDIEFSDTTLILYHMPGMEQGKSEEYIPSFKGRRVMYNPQFNFISKPYVQPKKIDLGENLSLTSK